ncbi:MAG: hypothetical protein CLLPBCKN_000332 [Chroococcidiopsis cubana SAG 39.79]|nr:hypothetical protein [Chroococcidiopsis cubana]MDZ4870944.1 hypothetical protein [Chroococcidiopsis cubana SAG 39.79]PSB64539.1 hypothetical protein C7B79_09310 [Chroococcidiopsis cubana CCALA 043]
MQFSSPYLTITNQLASLGVKPKYITDLDSATTALRATAKFLHGKELRSGGFAPSLAASITDAVSYLPKELGKNLSTRSGWLSASSPNVVNDVRAETMSQWVVNQYPQRRYPAAVIGSSNGAAVHLCAALGIPWLPQTLLISLRHPVDPDEPKQELEWAKAPAQQLLAKNPDLCVYQMHDPNQDRLKVPRVTYFRLKRTRLGTQFQQFLQQNLEPGATLFLLECQYSWLSTQVSDRHVFQFGGKGKLAPDDYFQHSQQIADFLQQNGSQHRYWEPPTPDGRLPESEWGFEGALRDDVEQFARQHGFRVRRIVFDFPQDLSPLVADLYRWWYQERGLPSDRLLVESFVYLQPWLALRLGLVPFWTVFNDRMSAERLNNYLDTAKPYDEIYMTLFSNGLKALGQASIEEWQSILSRARTRGQFIGVNQQTYPGDLASYTRHYTDLKKLEERYPIPESLTIQQLDKFLSQAGARYPVQWIDRYCQVN